MGSGVSGLYSGTHGSLAVPGSANYMSPSDNFARYISRRKDVDANGFYDVIAHGTKNSILIHVNGKMIEIDHRAAAHLFRTNPEMRGKSIRLLSCDTGSSSGGFAQNLANKLNVVVEAPTAIVWAYPGGHYIVAGRSSSNPNRPDLSKKGKFVKYYPGGRKK